MLNLPAFLALTRDHLAEVPVVLYRHENQLTYPFPPGEERDLTYGMINWLSMLAAERIFFNSQYHRDDWFGALPNMLKHFPDFTHLHRVPEVRQKASVLPVGVDLRRLDADVEAGSSQTDEPPLILWNQRWEYDKNPDTFLRALYALADIGISFRVALAGKSNRQTAPEFEAARERLGDRVVHFGYAEKKVYDSLLKQADIVVSTAIHEFFGVSIVEAIYAGCFPILPNQLSYPELVSPSIHDVCLYEDEEELIVRLRWALSCPDSLDGVRKVARAAVARYDWVPMARLYDEELEKLRLM